MCPDRGDVLHGFAHEIFIGFGRVQFLCDCEPFVQIAFENNAIFVPIAYILLFVTFRIDADEVSLSFPKLVKAFRRLNTVFF